MTPNDAKSLMPNRGEVDPEKVRLALDLWHRAIRKAASEGRNSVSGSELERVRTPIPEAAKGAALDELSRRGFKVHHASAKVSW